MNSDLSGKYECRDGEHDAEGGEETAEYGCNDCASQVVIGSVLVLWRPLLRNLYVCLQECVCRGKMCVHGCVCVCKNMCAGVCVCMCLQQCVCRGMFC